MKQRKVSGKLAPSPRPPFTESPLPNANILLLKPTFLPSEKVHELAQSVAVARLVILNLQPEGRQVVKSKEAELSCLVSFICRQLSFTSVKGRVQ